MNLKHFILWPLFFLFFSLFIYSQEASSNLFFPCKIELQNHPQFNFKLKSSPGADSSFTFTPSFLQNSNISITMPFINAKLKLNSSKTDITPYDFFNNLYENSQISAGIKVTSTAFNYSLPLTVNLYALNISLSNSFSRLNKPWFSCPSPLSSPVILLPGFSPAVSSGTAKYPTYVLQASYSLAKKQTINFEFAIDSQTNISSSIFSSINNSTFQISYINRTNNRTPQDSWFMTQKPFPSQKYSSLEFLYTWKDKFFSSSNAISLFENPFNLPSFSIRSHNSFSFSNFLMNAAFYYSPPETISANGTQLEKYLQFNINPQYSIKLNPVKITAGLLYQNDFSVTKNINPVFYNINYYKAQILLNLKEDQFSVKEQITHSTLDNTLSVNSSLNYSHSFKTTTEAAGLSLINFFYLNESAGNYYKSKNYTTLKLINNISFTDFFLNSLSLSYETTLKNYIFTKHNLYLAFSIGSKTKVFSWNGTVQIYLEFS